MKRSVLGLLFVLGVVRVAEPAPVVFWASDPVRPGETVLTLGEGFGEKPKVEILRLDDVPPGEPQWLGNWPAGGQAVEPLQASNQSVKFLVPSTCKPGVLAFRITTAAGAATGLLNRPVAWWAQGDCGIAATPGGWLRLFGKNLGIGRTVPPAKLVLRLERDGARPVRVEAECDGYSARASLPADLVPGRYAVAIHHGLGGASAWSDPVAIDVVQAASWPQTAFNVKDFGAEGNGVKDDTAAFQTALAKAEQNGGGVVYLPRGRYRLSDGLAVPRRTVLRGEKREQVALCWTDLAVPPESLVQGTNSFGLEELTLYAANYRHVICGDLGDRPEAGDVRLRRIRVRADLYRGHPEPKQVDERFRQSLRYSTGGGDTVRLGGRNVEISDCDLYGAGRVLFLSRVRGGRVSGCQLYNGRWGWYCISGSDGLVFEENQLSGADLMSTGGGLNCLDGSNASRNVFFARNCLSRMHGWDREAMTSDAGGELFFGKVAACQGATMTFAELNTNHRDWTGAGVFILDGTGAGQWRQVAAVRGATVEVDRPWTVAPDGSSSVSITMFQGHYLLVGNEFTDTGAMQFFGTSIECVVAGNRGTRMQGFRGLGLWYYGYQPNWCCQFLENEIAEGNYYHWDSAADAILEVAGAKRPPYDGPLCRAAVLRGNRLASNAHIRVGGGCRDVLVEGNRVHDAEQGIFVSREASGVLVRANQFANVVREVVDEEAVRRANEERLKRYLGRKEPVAVWTFDAMKGTKFQDASGNGFHAAVEGGVKQVPGGVRGQAAAFDGNGCLRVEEPAVFNAPDLTVSLWAKPAVLSGRRGLLAKRFHGAGAPLVLSQSAGAISFEAADPSGVWTFNFSSPPALTQNQWTHIAAVAKQGTGITLYVDGRPVATKANSLVRAGNEEPLILGREAWGGDPPKGDTPGFYHGLLDEVRLWTRALSAEEIRAEYAAR